MAVPVYVGDRVLVNAVVTGTNDYTIASTVAGYLSPETANISTGSRVAYVVVDSLTLPSVFEVGEGIYTNAATDTISRDTILATHLGATGSPSKYNWPDGGSKYLFLAPSARRFVMYDSDGGMTLNTHLTLVSGEVASVSVSTPGDRNTGLFFPGADKVALAAGGVKVFEVTPTSTTVFGPLTVTSSLTVSPGGITVSSTANFSSEVRVGATIDTPGSGNTNTGASISENGASHFSVAGGDYAILVNRNDTEGVGITFNRSGTQIGFIYVSTSVRYATSSDYRLKENFEVLEDGIFTVQSVPVYRFNWKEKPDGPKIQGFLAHEVQEFLPQAVIGQKDGEDMQGIDHSQLVPALWGAMKTLIQRVEDLEDQVRKLTPP